MDKVQKKFFGLQRTIVKTLQTLSGNNVYAINILSAITKKND
jgi:hypothetical protein